jgi:hypothetical protein
MENAPIGKARRLMLVVGTKSSNAGLEWNEKRTSTPKLGRPGMQIEVPEGSIILRDIKARSVEAIPLDGGGRMLAKAIPLKKTPAGWELTLSAVTPWYVIQVAR